MRKILPVIAALAMALLICACGEKKPEKLEFTSALDEESRAYYVGDDFESYIETADGNVCRVPHIYVVYSDGTRSGDVSGSAHTKFSGYDLTKAGEQTVTVKYFENGKTVEAQYDILVKEQKVLFIEAEDPIRLNLVPFRVGEKFNTVFTDSSGTKRGVTVRLRMNDPSQPYLSYFADDPAISSAEFDTSGCALDEEGCFTKAGTFTVQVRYEGFSAEYDIRVEE